MEGSIAREDFLRKALCGTPKFPPKTTTRIERQPRAKNPQAITFCEEIHYTV
jgi:hypothetical protein